MNERDFCYWLQGYMELTYSQELNQEQVAIIKNHLNLVFNKLTPNIQPNPLHTYSEYKVVPIPTMNTESIPHLTC